MEILKDEGGQATAEYVLLFGGIIVIMIVGIYIINSYFSKPATNFNIGTDINKIRQGV